MNVKNALRKSADKARGQQPHVSRQADQVDFGRLQRGNDFRFVFFTRFLARRDDNSVEAAFLSYLDAMSIRQIGYDDGNLSRKAAIRDVVSNGFEVGAASGKKDTEFLHQKIASALRVGDFALALYDAADGIGPFAGAIDQGLCLLEFLERNDEQHANTHVEGAHHLVVLNIAELLQMLEDGQNGPGSDLDYCSDSLR